MRSGTQPVLAFCLGALLISASAAQADEIRDYYRGARAIGMGDAFVGLADDDEAIFYNPAGLAGVKHSELRLLPIQIETSSDVILAAQTGAKAFKHLSGSDLNVVMGKNLSFHSSVIPTYIDKNIGIAMIADGQLGLYAQNQAAPNILVGFETTTGVQLSTGFRIIKVGKKDDGLRLGVSGKFLMRRGGYQLIPIAEALNLNETTIKKKFGTYHPGYGGDLGLQYIKTLGKSLQLSGGTSYTDIGDTTFAPGTDAIPGSLNVGVAAKYAYGPLFAFSLTGDIHHLTEGGDFRKLTHAGAELQLGLISLDVGINQVYATYGVGLDFWVFKLTAASYGEELGTYAYQNEERRWLTQMVVKFEF